MRLFLSTFIIGLFITGCVLIHCANVQEKNNNDYRKERLNLEWSRLKLHERQKEFIIDLLIEIRDLLAPKQQDKKC